MPCCDPDDVLRCVSLRAEAERLESSWAATHATHLPSTAPQPPSAADPPADDDGPAAPPPAPPPPVPAFGAITDDFSFAAAPPAPAPLPPPPTATPSKRGHAAAGKRAAASSQLPAVQLVPIGKNAAPDITATPGMLGAHGGKHAPSSGKPPGASASGKHTSKASSSKASSKGSKGTTLKLNALLAAPAPGGGAAAAPGAAVAAAIAAAPPRPAFNAWAAPLPMLNRAAPGAADPPLGAKPPSSATAGKARPSSGAGAAPAAAAVAATGWGAGGIQDLAELELGTASTPGGASQVPGTPGSGATQGAAGMTGTGSQADSGPEGRSQGGGEGREEAARAAREEREQAAEEARALAEAAAAEQRRAVLHSRYACSSFLPRRFSF